MSRSESRYRRPSWRLPPGVAPGTWEYTQRESIAQEYSTFLQHTPLLRVDMEHVLAHLTPAVADRQARVIDLGCGDGRALRALWQRGYDVLGIDLSQAMLDRVVEADAQHQSRLVRANLVQLECLNDLIADHAICLFSTIGMIQGRLNRRQFLKHVARVVKPRGKFILHVHNRNDAWREQASRVAYFKSLWQSLRSKRAELGDRTYSYRGLGDMFLHTYSYHELKRDLTTTGWQVETILPLSPYSDGLLNAPSILPSLRAGGFIAISTHD